MAHTKEQARAYRAANREKFLAYSRAWRASARGQAYQTDYKKRHRDRILKRKRERRLQETYGISVAEYDALLVAQGGVCAICKTVPSTAKRMHVDHCHDTGVVRGILCHYCNTAIGAFREDLEVLLFALQYLIRAGRR